MKDQKQQKPLERQIKKWDEVFKKIKPNDIEALSSELSSIENKFTEDCSVDKCGIYTGNAIMALTLLAFTPQAIKTYEWAKEISDKDEINYEVRERFLEALGKSDIDSVTIDCAEKVHKFLS